MLEGDYIVHFEAVKIPAIRHLPVLTGLGAIVA